MVQGEGGEAMKDMNYQGGGSWREGSSGKKRDTKSILGIRVKKEMN